MLSMVIIIVFISMFLGYPTSLAKSIILNKNYK